MPIYPPFLPCLRYAAQTFGLIFLSIFGVVVITHLIRHQSPLASLRSDFWLIPVFFAAITIVFALVVYVGARVWAWSFDQYEVRGRTYFGKRISIPWPDVAEVKPTNVKGIPALLITSRSTGKELFAYTLGVDLQQIHAQLSLRAGPGHMLTQCFDTAEA